MTEDSKDKKTWKEEIEISSDALIAKIKDLAAEAQVRRVRIIEPDGDVAVDIPLSVGAIAGGVVVLAAPVLAIIGAIAAFATKVKIEIVREEEGKDEDSAV
ncbi:DUF4342 domain-containing protein [Thalassovita sp.]|uniref:DUF4342 domain-containing protein n=1 Tax=Thalassovita sp. TaxID=1979401 RepID=UPI002B27B4A4|nr:DUF4342 domain-containing protein [Thalassovita sp.]